MSMSVGCQDSVVSFSFVALLNIYALQKGTKRQNPKQLNRPPKAHIHTHITNKKNNPEKYTKQLDILELFVSSQALKYFMCHFMNSSSEIK